MTGELFDVMAHDFMELADKLGVVRERATVSGLSA